MADNYWQYSGARQPPTAPPPPVPSAAKRSRLDLDLPVSHESPGFYSRDEDLPIGHELPGFYSRDEERGGKRLASDNEALGALHEPYLPGQISSYGAGDPHRPLSGGLPGHHIDDPYILGIGGIEPGMGGENWNMDFEGGRSEKPLPPDASNPLFVESLPGMSGENLNMGFGGGRSEMPLPPDASNTLFIGNLPGMGGENWNMGFGGGRSEMPLSPDASNTLFVESLPGRGGENRNAGGENQNMGFRGGRSEMPLHSAASNTLFVESLPTNCTRREVAHIFRPFVGFREVRLINKGSRRAGGEPVVLCFVDFTTPAHAAVALEALQGYKLDEHDCHSAILRLQFARFPGLRSGGGPRGKH